MKNRMLATAGILTLLLLAEGAWVWAFRPDPAQATRNSAGTESIPNTFVSGTVISSSAVNANFADLGVEMTDSLNRSGKGGMLAALRGVDGTVAAPAFSWTSETGSGWYRIGASDLGLAISGTKKLELTSSLFTLSSGVSLGIGAAATNLLDVTISGSASTTIGSWLEASLADANTVSLNIGKATVNGQTGIITYAKNATSANSTFCLGVWGGSASTLCVDGNNKTIIGASGTGIGASKIVTTSWTPGAITVPNCQTTTVSVTNIAFGDSCILNAPADLAAGSGFLTCRVKSAGTVQIAACGLAANYTPPSGTYTIQTFQATN